jgi:hypothetical protein
MTFTRFGELDGDHAAAVLCDGIRQFVRLLLLAQCGVLKAQQVGNESPF